MNLIQPHILINTGHSKLWIAENYTTDFLPTMRNIPLQCEPPIMIANRECRQRRNIGFFSDESIGYAYSGQIMGSLPLSAVPLFQELLPQVNQSLKSHFNGILVNYYVNGEKYISAHSDDEKSLDKGG